MKIKNLGVFFVMIFFMMPLQAGKNRRYQNGGGSNSQCPAPFGNRRDDRKGLNSPEVRVSNQLLSSPKKK